MPKTTKTTVTKTRSVGTQPDPVLVELQQLRKQTMLSTDALLGILIVLFSVISAVFLPETLFRLFFANNVEAINQEFFALIPTIAYGVGLAGVLYVIIRLFQVRRSA